MHYWFNAHLDQKILDGLYRWYLNSSDALHIYFCLMRLYCQICLTISCLWLEALNVILFPLNCLPKIERRKNVKWGSAAMQWCFELFWKYFGTCKGQLISKCPLSLSNRPKNQQNQGWFVRIPALVSKKRSNQKDKGTLYR